MKLKKHYIFAALATIAIASCTSDDYIADIPPVDINDGIEMPIVFSSMNNGITRADITGADAAGMLGGQFVVSGYKGAQSEWNGNNIVFDNYVVKYYENTANTTQSNSANWEYVGTVEGAYGSEEQTIKYWDEKRDGHYFWAIGDFSKRGGYDYTESTLPDPHVIEVENITQMDVQDDSKCLYFTKPKYVPKSKYGQPVTLTFLRYCSRIRIGFYEDITQSGGDKRYKVVGVDFYRVKDDGTFNTNELPTTNVCLRGNFVNEGKVRLTYTNASFKGGDNIDNVTTETVPVENGASKYMDFGVLNIAGTQSGVLPTSSSEALFTTNNGSQYTKVLPYNNTEGLTLQCDILVHNQNESQFTQQNVLASIPAHYTNWQPNQSYTYIFKIVTTPDGAAIILANVEVESWKSDGLIEDEWHNW